MDYHAGDYLSGATGTRLQLPSLDDGNSGTFDMGRGILAGDRSWANPGKALTHNGDVLGQGASVWMAPANDFIFVAAIDCTATNSSVSQALNDVATLLVLNYANALPSGPLVEDPASAGLVVQDHAVFSYLTLPGLAYVVETTTNLQVNWAPINGANGQTAAGLVSSYTDASLSPAKFFRVRAAP